MLAWAHRIAHLCGCHRLSAIPLLNLLFYVQAQLLAGLCHGLQRSGGLQRLLATASLFTASSCFLRFLLYIVKRLRGHLLNNFLLFVLVCWTLSKSQIEQVALHRLLLHHVGDCDAPWILSLWLILTCGRMVH